MKVYKLYLELHTVSKYVKYLKNVNTTHIAEKPLHSVWLGY